MKYKAIIFDLDGTLLDTIQDLGDSMNDTLKSMGYPVHDIQTYLQLVGNGVENLVTRALPPDIKSEELVKRCVSNFRNIYSDNWTKKTKAYGGIPELLNKLKANQIQTAVLSNKLHVFTVQMVQHFFGSDYFNDVRGEMPGIPKKPDPSAALVIAEKLSSNPAQMIFVGDSGTDMQTAVNAGMYPVGVLWGYRSKDDLTRYGAKQIIDKPEKLLGLMGI
ncbi:MAG: HAD family hydrolase [Spirochaetes bacterium]|nr:HAD family hydrolase [Spirochaetota bacterium]